MNIKYIINRQINRQINKQINRQIDRQIDKQIDSKIERQLHRYVDRQICIFDIQLQLGYAHPQKLGVTRPVACLTITQSIYTVFWGVQLGCMYGVCVCVHCNIKVGSSQAKIDENFANYFLKTENHCYKVKHE